MIFVAFKNGKTYTVARGIRVAMLGGLFVVKDDDDAALAWFAAQDVAGAWKDGEVDVGSVPLVEHHIATPPLNVPRMRGKGWNQ